MYISIIVWMYRFGKNLEFFGETCPLQAKILGTFLGKNARRRRNFLENVLLLLKDQAGRQAKFCYKWCLFFQFYPALMLSFINSILTLMLSWCLFLDPIPSCLMLISVKKTDAYKKKHVLREVKWSPESQKDNFVLN